MFLSFVYILRKLKVNDNGYIFLMSSHLISEPNPNMSLSVTYRLALSSLLKMLSVEPEIHYKISCQKLKVV